MLFSYSAKLTPADLVKMVSKTHKDITNECCGSSFIDISEDGKQYSRKDLWVVIKSMELKLVMFIQYQRTHINM